MIYPLKKIHVTQYFGERPLVYKRFGYKGHNGIDFRAPNGTPVYAPHDGVIKERRNDTNGYGKYVKIESAVEGSVLAHFQDWKVPINKNVKQGELVGLADNTGFSTGSHLHWGYYKMPRNRSNGYGGYIDQLPILEENTDNMIPQWLETMYSEFGVDIKRPEGDIRGRVQEFFDAYRKKEELEKRIKSLEKELAGAEGEAAEYEARLRISERSRAESQGEIEEARRGIHQRDTEIERLTRRLAAYADKVVLTKDEYQKLTQRRILDRYSIYELLWTVIKRLLRRR